MYKPITQCAYIIIPLYTECSSARRSSACSIVWSDSEGKGVVQIVRCGAYLCEVRGVALKRVGRGEGEGEGCLGEAVADVAGHRDRLGLVSDIRDEERVEEVVLCPSHIQSEWSLPCHHYIITRGFDFQI